MGRKGLLEKISETIQIPENQENTWLVSYEFQGAKTNSNFYKLLNQHLNKLKKDAYVESIQTNTIITNSLHGAITTAKLAEHYKAQVLFARVNTIQSEKVQTETVTLKIDKDIRLPLIRAIFFKYIKKLDQDTEPIPTSILETLLTLIYGCRVTLAVITDESTRDTKKQIIAYQGPQTHQEPVVLMGEQVWIALRSIERYLLRAEKTRDMHQEFYNILWSLNYKEEPPHATNDSIKELLYEQPIQTWRQRLNTINHTFS